MSSVINTSTGLRRSDNVHFKVRDSCTPSQNTAITVNTFGQIHNHSIQCSPCCHLKPSNKRSGRCNECVASIWQYIQTDDLRRLPWDRYRRIRLQPRTQDTQVTVLLQLFPIQANITLNSVLSSTSSLHQHHLHYRNFQRRSLTYVLPAGDARRLSRKKNVTKFSMKYSKITSWRHKIDPFIALLLERYITILKKNLLVIKWQKKNTEVTCLMN